VTSVVDLCNLALLRIGTRSTITSLTDGSAEANACNLLYPQFLNRIFADYDWKFARRRESLTLSSQPSTRPEWVCEFPITADCVRVRSVMSVAPIAQPDLLPGIPYLGRIAFDLGYSVQSSTQAVWTNINPVMVDYTTNGIPPDGWLPAFTSAFILGFAAELATTITSNGQLAEGLRGLYGQALDEAQNADTDVAALATNATEPWADLCNQALVLLGSPKVIRSITDGTPEAAACGQIYPMVINEIFGLHDWRFAVARAPLVAQAGTNSQWAYEYPVPTDCARVRGLIDATRLPTQYLPNRRMFDCRIAFAQGYSLVYACTAVWTNLSTAILEYTTNSVPIASWPPALRSAVVWRLAAELAMPILRDAKIAQVLGQQFQPLLAKAMEADGGMEVVSINYVPDWLQVRNDCDGWR
jgi:hypothetical protein